MSMKNYFKLKLYSVKKDTFYVLNLIKFDDEINLHKND